MRPQKQAGYATVDRDDRARRPDIGAVRGCSASCRSVFGDGTVARAPWIRTCCSAGCAPRTSTAVYKCLAAAGPRRVRTPARSADVTSCPGAESCKLAVTQSRGLGPRARRSPASSGRDLVAALAGDRHQDQRLPERLRSASHRGHRVPGQPARRSAPAGAAVLRDGRRRRRRRRDDVRAARGEDSGAPLRARARTARSRCTRISAADRESPLAFFRRVELGAVKAVLGDLERLLPEDGEPQDFIDLAEVERVQPGGDGRGVQRLASGEPPEASSQNMPTPTLAPVSLLDTIGRTPLLRLYRLGRETRLGGDAPGVEIYAKAEFQNPGGSVKDRAAVAIVRDAERSGRLRPGGIILDATSGNTGIAYAMIAAARGYRLKLCVPGNVTAERLRTLRAYGADLVITNPMEGTDGAIREARRLHAEAPGKVLLRRSIQQRRELAGALRYDRRRDPRADRRPRHALRRRPWHERHVRGHRPAAAGVPS